MAQDTDVARVAAALRAPGIRYRSFGNEPVRSAATAAGGEFSLLSAGMTAAAEVAAQQGNPPETWSAPTEPAFDPAPYASQTDTPQNYASQAYAPQPYAAQDYAAQTSAAQTSAAPAYPVESYAAAAPAWSDPPPASWSAPESATSNRREPAPPSWAEPAQPSWTEIPAPSWAATPDAPASWPEPAAPAWPAPAAALAAPPAASSLPVAPIVEPWPAEPAPPPPSAMPAWTPAPPAAPAPVVHATPVPIAPPIAAAQTAVAAPVATAPRVLSLLQAADAINSAAARPPLSSLAEIGTVPSPAASVEPPRAAPAALFPLIEALDLPGGFTHRRAPLPLAAAIPAPPPAGPKPASAVTLPLAELFRLLAAGPAPAEPAFALLRSQSARALGPQT